MSAATPSERREGGLALRGTVGVPDILGLLFVGCSPVTILETRRDDMTWRGRHPCRWGGVLDGVDRYVGDPGLSGRKTEDGSEMTHSFLGFLPFAWHRQLSR